MTAIHDIMGERYDGVSGSSEGIRLTRERVHWLCRHATGADVLDAGCSQGVAAILVGREGRSVAGVDIQLAAIESANERLRREEPVVRERVTFRTGELYSLPFEDGSFDTVLLGEVLEHLIDVPSALSELRRVLRADGALVITTPYGVWRSADHKDPLYLLGLLAALGQAFEVTDAELIAGERNAFLGLVARAASPEGTGPAVPWRLLLQVAEERLAAQDLAVERERQQLKASEARARDERHAAAERYKDLRAAEAERRKDLAARELEQRRLAVAREAEKLDRHKEQEAARREQLSTRFAEQRAQLLAAEVAKRRELEVAHEREVTRLTALAEAERRSLRELVNEERRAYLALLERRYGDHPDAKD